MRLWRRGGGPDTSGSANPGSEAEPLGPVPAAPWVFDDAFLRRLERMALRVQRVVGTVGGRSGPRRTPAADFVDHRPYSPGDDLRHIDWHAAARHDEVFVKIGRSPQAASVHIVLDVSRSMAAWPDKHRLSGQLAAALGWLSLAHGDRVTAAAVPGSSGAAAWGPASGTSRGPSLLGWLSELQPAPSGGTELMPVVRSVARAAPAGGLLVLISDLWVADDLDAALRLVPPPRWEVLVLQILGRRELDPDLAGAFELRDSESGATLTVMIDDGVRADYRRALGERLERLRGLAAARGATLAVLPADWPLEQAVVPYLQRRAVLT
jgi:uncharacterized protein (DUF58 family)